MGEAKKNALKPHRSRYWVIPPEANADFVACMEDVLDVYQLAYNAAVPVICMDELSKQLIDEITVPLPPAPGRVGRSDYEYKRNGTANIFMFTEPLAGWRRVMVTDRRTKVDWAFAIRELLDVHYPNAPLVRLVMDNLNTHAIGSLYEAFEPEEARRLARRLEIHHTPKHGSWLNIAECELSVLSRQCLDRRIASKHELEREVLAWQDERNSSTIGVDWQFTTADARVKLKRLYPRTQTAVSSKLNQACLT